jgi:hypothetical protein
MQTRRRTNFILGLVFLLVALAALLYALDVLPNGLYDVLLRAWPALLVLLGLSVFLGSRMRFGSLIALIVTAGLVGGVATYAFSTRAEQSRNDYTADVQQTVSAEVTLLRLSVTLGSSDLDIELSRAPAGQDRIIIGEFSGSSESRFEVEYLDEGASASLILTESLSQQFPLLENIGRGALSLQLPADLPLDVAVVGEQGRVRLDMSGLSVERMNLNLARGSALVTLPVYKPLGTPAGESLGTLAVGSGNLTLFVPSEISARLELERRAGLPQYDPNLYNSLFGDTVLEARGIDNAEIIVRYNVAVPNGEIRVQVPGQSQPSETP